MVDFVTEKASIPVLRWQVCLLFLLSPVATDCFTSPVVASWNTQLRLTPPWRTSQCTSVKDVSLSMAGKGFAREKVAASPTPAPTEYYPPMTREEVSNWMNHIPVYAVTDNNGNAQAIQLGEDRAVVYFFMSSIVADAYKEKLEETYYPKNNENESSGKTELTVSGLFLGKVWFDFLHPDLQSSDTTEYRLVPDPRDLTSARTVLSMEATPNDELDDVTNNDMEIAEAESGAFQLPYNEIPLFYVDHMPHSSDKKSQEEIKKLLNQVVSSSYMFFSAQNMFSVLDKLKESGGDNLDDSNDALCSLYDIVEMMQQPSSTTDFRNIVLIPPAPIEQGTISDEVLAKQLKDPSTILSQSFFLPLLQES